MQAESRNPLVRYMHWLHTRWPAGTIEQLPEVRADFTTAVPGVYIVGDLTGVPLLKFSADSGARAVDAIADDPRFQAARKDRPDGVHELLIIGGGVAGMAAALQAKKYGLDYVVVEATQVFSTVVNFPKGKPIYTYPKEMTPAGALQLHAAVKESLLDELHAQTSGVTVRTARVERIQKKGAVLHCQLAPTTTEKPESPRPLAGEGEGEGEGGGDGKRARSQAPTELKSLRVILAIGRSGNFRQLEVPGEDLDKVYNRLHDPRDYAGKQALVVGGGDSALETAIALCESGAQVILSYRKPEFSRPKPANVERLAALVAAPPAPGSLQLVMPSTLTEIRPGEVVLSDENQTPVTVPNDVVFSMIGREPPLDFLRRSGLRIAGETSPLGWVLLSLFFLFCFFLYTWKSGGPTESWLDPSIWANRLIARAHDRATLLGTLAVSLKSRSFYYTVLYSACIVVFGLRRMQRRKTPYVRLQTWTLIAVQVVPLFILPEIILPWLGYNGVFSHGAGKTIADHLFEPYISEAAYAAQQWPDWGHPRAYWRAYGFILAWPLSVYNVFADKPMAWWLVISFLQTFVLIPLLVWRWGKGAYCGWICSCGALAETMGDEQRHKMPHGPKWNRLNMLGQAVLAVAFVLLVVRIVAWIAPGSWAARVFHVMLEGKNDQGRLLTYLNYKWLIDVFLGGILGVGLYFKYSGRVWCRFACPLAALMHIYARFSRFRIFAEKKKCISCNVCTSVCHMGIDVMSFANKGLPMQDPQCVRCSACVQSCPTGVLTFGLADAKGGLQRLDRLPASLVQLRENPAARKPTVAN